MITFPITRRQFIKVGAAGSALLALPGVSYAHTPELVWRDVRELHWMGALVILVTALVAATYLTSRRPTAWAVTMAQTGYLTLWLAALGMDEVRSQSIRLQDDLQQDFDESKEVS